MILIIDDDIFSRNLLIDVLEALAKILQPTKIVKELAPNKLSVLNLLETPRE